MKKVVISVVSLALLIGIIFIAFPPDRTPPLPEPAPVEAPTPEPPPAEPAIKYPIAEPPVAVEPPPVAPPEPAPSIVGIDQADDVMKELLSLLGNRKKLIELFYLDHFIQRFVVTIDNLPRNDLSRRQFPVKAAGGLFLVQGEADNQVISLYNARRYSLYVEIAEAFDSAKLVDLYIRDYPLFQKAYTNLGYPSAYFNDRLIEVIDHLLETPELEDPIQLERPGVLYTFADPELENRSAGQKMLLRIGHENAMKVKAKLRDLRQQLMTRIVR